MYNQFLCKLLKNSFANQWQISSHRDDKTANGNSLKNAADEKRNVKGAQHYPLTI
jgi:hypothetical protein